MDPVWLAVGLSVTAIGLELYRMRWGGNERQLQGEIDGLKRQKELLWERLLAAEDRIKELEAERKILEAERCKYMPNCKFYSVQERETKSQERVLVVHTSAKGMDVDVAAFREVQSRTGLAFARMDGATSEKLERYLERWRYQRRPVRHVHLSAHMGPEGIVLDDKTVTPLWLSEQLVGAEVLVLDGCQSDYLGDLMGVVPTVITLRNDIETHDAMRFAGAFWEEIGNNVLPEDAFWNALERVPAAVREHAEIHI